MLRIIGNRRIALPIMASLLFVVPLLSGQGCPGTGNNITGLRPGDIVVEDEPAGVNGNTPPTFVFTEPRRDRDASIGDIVTISWRDSDPDDDARITLQLDPDNVLDNGNELTILANRSENLDGAGDTIDFDTVYLKQTTYRIVARINDDVNPQQVVVADGRLLMYGDLLPANSSPVITTIEPSKNLTLSQDKVLTVEYCGGDPDDGEDDFGDVVPDILIILDTDDDPTNDFDFADEDAGELIDEICAGDLPYEMDGIIILGCDKDEDCNTLIDVVDTPTDPNEPADPNVVPPVGPATFTYTLDIEQVPPREDGSPYYVRTSMWDRVNPAVHDYATGRIAIGASAKGTVDLAYVGNSISGARFVGFNGDAWLGYTGVEVGDFDVDGADDFVVVARYGQPYERGKVGSAFLIYGMPDQRYGGEININNFTGEYRGTLLAMGHVRSNTSTPGLNSDGITSITTITDVTGDNQPEVIIGLPRIVGFYDYHDDDPCDDPAIVYSNSSGTYLWPDTQSTDVPGNDDIGAYNNDTLRFDPQTQTSIADFITGGYVIYTESDSLTNRLTVEIALTGQRDTKPIPDDLAFDNRRMVTEESLIVDPGAVPAGLRWRGNYLGGPDARFGQSVNALPDMGDGNLYAARDGVPELLISAPGYSENSGSPRGQIIMYYGMNFTNKIDSEVRSFPQIGAIVDGDGNCIGRGTSDYHGLERTLYGEQPGDEFGYASSAGDFNLDGHVDILCGAPSADRNGLTECGVVYIIFGRVDFGDLYLGSLTLNNGYFPADNPPRIEIIGTQAGARIGERQTQVGDVNNDGIPDIAFSSPSMNSPTEVGAGFVGIIFGGQRITGENTFLLEELGQPQLKGVRFYGTLNSGAGETVNNAGDFNGDGRDDLLITAPNEVHVFQNADGQPDARRGVAYLIFGGPHLNNKEFSLSEVGTDKLPGLIFVSPYNYNTVDEAAIIWAGAVGDMDGDGFDDVAMGLPQADYVYPANNPTQRRVDAGEFYIIYGNNASSR